VGFFVSGLQMGHWRDTKPQNSTVLPSLPCTFQRH